jgi:putative transcriptional regulator
MRSAISCQAFSLAMLALLLGAIGACRGGPDDARAPMEPDPGFVDLGLEGLANGRFLIATREVAGPFFAESVVLLIEYGPAGAVGIIVNRPTSVDLEQLLPDQEALRGRPVRVFLGGPVAMDTSLLLLLRSESAPADARPVVGDLHLIESLESLRGALSGKAATAVHAYLGYAGWGARQLDREVERGDWYVAHARPDLVFADKSSEIWRDLIVEFEGLEVRQRSAPDRRLARVPVTSVNHHALGGSR